MDFSEMVKNHEMSGAEISIATIPVNAKDASEFGILKADDNNLITFTDDRKYTINLKGNKSPKTIQIPINHAGPSFKEVKKDDKEKLKESIINKLRQL
jgi:ADP-glucose pyrophosphorylase